MQNYTIETKQHLHFVFMFWLVWHMLLPYAHHLVCFQSQRSLVVAPVVANGALQEKVVSSFIIFASLLLLLQDCKSLKENNYRKVMSSNTSHLEAHAGFFRLLMKRIFDCTLL